MIWRFNDTESRRFLSNVVHWVAGGLLLATLLRMMLVVLSLPITGYANNLDFIRQSACVGVWEHYPDRPKSSANLDRPVNDLIFDGDRVPGLCMRSSDNLFVWSAARLHRKGAYMQLRQVGALKLVTAAALMLFVVAQPIAALLRLALCFGLFLVFGDIAVLTYFNTLYVDASGVIAATIMLALTACVAASRRAPGWASCAVAALVLLWLGAVKPQYGPLAVLLGIGAAACIANRWAMAWKPCLLAAAACIGPLLFTGLNAGTNRIMATADRVNRADTVLGTVLLAAGDQAQALRMLGLPSSCDAAIGDTGYTPAIRHGALCPEIAGVSRLRLLPLFVVQPETLWRPLASAVVGSRPSYLRLSKFERADDAERLRFRVIRATSLSTWLALAPNWLYAAIVLAACLTGLLGGLVWVIAISTSSPRLAAAWSGEMTMLILGGVVTCYALVSAVFGDGVIELVRHTVCVLVGIAFFSVGGLGLLGHAIRRRHCWV